MDCVDFRACIERGEPLAAPAREHARSCPACSAVMDDDASLARRLLSASTRAEANTAGKASLEATRRMLAQDRGWLGALRARPTWQRVGALWALLAGMLAWEALAGPANPALEVVPHALLFVVATTLVLWPLGRPLPRLGRALTACVAGVLPIAFGLWAHARAAAPMPESPPWACLSFGAALVVPFLVLQAALDRRAAIGVEQALLAGSIGGVAGNALLHLHCPSDALAHLLLGHAPLGVLGALAAVALALGRAQARRAA